MTGKNLFTVFGLVIFSFLFTKCTSSLSGRNVQQVSTSIQESKKYNVFLYEYSIQSAESYDEDSLQPLSKIWVEKRWYLTLDSLGNETYKIDSMNSSIVFTLKPNSKLNKENYLKKWIIWDKDSSSTGIISNMVTAQPQEKMVSDTLVLSVYQLSTQYNYKENLKPLYKIVATKSYLTF